MSSLPAWRARGYQEHPGLTLSYQASTLPPPTQGPSRGGLLTVGWRSGYPTCTDPPPGPQAERFYWGKKKRGGLGLCSCTLESRSRAQPSPLCRRALPLLLVPTGHGDRRRLPVTAGDKRTAHCPCALSAPAVSGFPALLLGQVQAAVHGTAGPEGGWGAPPLLGWVGSRPPGQLLLTCTQDTSRSLSRNSAAGMTPGRSTAEAGRQADRQTDEEMQRMQVPLPPGPS